MVRIIDTSVAIKWFVKEDGFEKAFAILEQVLEKPALFAVPELFYFELIHVFNRLISHPSKVQYQLLSQVVQLGIHRFSMNIELLSEIAVFQRLGLSGYDSAYVSLARLLNGKWITCDEKAHNLVAKMKLSDLL